MADFTTQYLLTVTAGSGGTIAATTAPNGFYNAANRADDRRDAECRLLLHRLDGRELAQRHRQRDERHHYCDDERPGKPHRQLRADSESTR